MVNGEKGKKTKYYLNLDNVKYQTRPSYFHALQLVPVASCKLLFLVIVIVFYRLPKKKIIFGPPSQFSWKCDLVAFFSHICHQISLFPIIFQLLLFDLFLQNLFLFFLMALLSSVKFTFFDIYWGMFINKM